MDWFTALAQALASGLGIWESKEKTRHQDRLVKLQTEYYEEKKKPHPNMAVLDDLEFQLVVLSRAFSAAAQGGQKAGPQA